MRIFPDYRDHERPVAAWCDPSFVHVCLADGRKIETPIWWYPRLLEATPAERNNAQLMLDGIHWPDVDEDLSIRGMLLGIKAKGAKEPAAREAA